MKAYRVVLFCMLMLLTLSAAWAQVPSFSQGAGNTCTGITVFAIPMIQETRFTYLVAVENGATFNGLDVLEVNGLAVYPNAGAAATGPTFINPIAIDWQALPFDPAVNGFAYTVVAMPVTPNPGVLPGQSKTIGQAIYAATPPNQQFLVSVVYRNTNGSSGQGYCNIIATPVPEPGTLTLLGMGLAPLAGIIRRRRK